MFILIKYSLLKDNQIIIPKFLPKKIQNYLIELKEISQFSSLNYFLDLHIKNSIFFFVSLIMFSFIFYTFY